MPIKSKAFHMISYCLNSQPKIILRSLCKFAYIFSLNQTYENIYNDDTNSTHCSEVYKD